VLSPFYQQQCYNGTFEDCPIMLSLQASDKNDALYVLEEVLGLKLMNVNDTRIWRDRVSA
jgi:hypothetical protein